MLRSVRRVPSLHSSVRLCRGYTCLLFLHTSAGKNPAGSVPGRQEAAVPAAGADSVGTSPPQTAPVRPHQGRSRCSLIQRPCLGANHRRTPLLPPCLAPTGWAVPAQAREAVCLPFAPVSSAAPGSLASPFRDAPEPAAPTSSRPPPGPRSTRFARSAPYGTGRLTDAALGHLHNPRVCETASTIGQPGAHARASVRYRPSYPARTDGKDEYTYTRKQRLPPLRVMLMVGVSFEVLGSYCFA